MTMQEIFDISARHLLTQNCKSFTNMCLYRCEKDGVMLQCAAAPFIPDDKYDEEMEDNGFHTINDRYNLGYTNEEVDIICDLQIIHDCCEPEYWKDRLKKLAERRKLDSTVLSEFDTE